MQGRKSRARNADDIERLVVEAGGESERFDVIDVLYDRKQHRRLDIEGEDIEVISTTNRGHSRSRAGRGRQIELDRLVELAGQEAGENE